jgi:hypothetical protein
MPTLSAAQPHDALFKWAFTQLEHLAGLLAATLPAAITAAARWSTLRLEPGSFVSRALRHRHTDVLCSVEVGGQPLLLYTLIEHQRKPAPLMAFRVDLYEARIWERYADAHPNATKLPPILPIVLHHSDTGWTAPTRFEDVIACEGEARAALAPYTPHFSFLLVDLSPAQASAMMERALTALGQMVLFCMSVAGDDRRLQREIGRMSAAIDEVLRAPDDHAAFEALLRYLKATHRRMSIDKLKGLLAGAAGSRSKEAMVAVLEELELPIERKARREGGARLLMKQMRARFGEVPAPVAARIKAAGDAELNRWAVRVLSAPTPAAVVEDAGAAAPRKAKRS